MRQRASDSCQECGQPIVTEWMTEFCGKDCRHRYRGRVWARQHSDKLRAKYRQRRPFRVYQKVVNRNLEAIALYMMMNE